MSNLYLLIFCSLTNTQTLLHVCNEGSRSATTYVPLPFTHRWHSSRMPSQKTGKKGLQKSAQSLYSNTTARFCEKEKGKIPFCKCCVWLEGSGHCCLLRIVCYLPRIKAVPAHCKKRILWFISYVKPLTVSWDNANELIHKLYSKLENITKRNVIDSSL